MTQTRDLEAGLPFRLLGMDSDPGGEFINHHWVAYQGQRQLLVSFVSQGACVAGHLAQRRAPRSARR